MDWKAETGTDMLTRIVALLFALAGLAERAAGRSPPVRRLVLWLLWQADTVARDFVADCASNATGRQWSPAMVRSRHHPDEAMNLAASLRSLALALRSMATQMRRMPLLHLAQASAASGHNGRRRYGIFQDVLNAASSLVDRRDTS